MRSKKANTFCWASLLAMLALIALAVFSPDWLSFEIHRVLILASLGCSIGFGFVSLLREESSRFLATTSIVAALCLVVFLLFYRPLIHNLSGFRQQEEAEQIATDNAASAACLS